MTNNLNAKKKLLKLLHKSKSEENKASTNSRMQAHRENLPYLERISSSKNATRNTALPKLCESPLWEGATDDQSKKQIYDQVYYKVGKRIDEVPNRHIIRFNSTKKLKEMLKSPKIRPLVKKSSSSLNFCRPHRTSSKDATLWKSERKWYKNNQHRILDKEIPSTKCSTEAGDKHISKNARLPAPPEFFKIRNSKPKTIKEVKMSKSKQSLIWSFLRGKSPASN